jgi:DNA mismatch repair protein MutS
MLYSLTQMASGQESLSPPRAPLDDSQATPAMRQYLDAKRQYRDAIVFFRMGDFYEMFYEDALVGSRALDLTLTSRSKDTAGGAIPMCGVPYHAADTYLARLIKKGFRVAICDQVEDPRKAKGLVRREVTRLVSPGTFTESSYLEAREPAFIMAVVSSSAPPGSDDGPTASRIGVALMDLSTGEFSTSELDGPSAAAALADELLVLRPREILIPSDLDRSRLLPDAACAGITFTHAEPWIFEHEFARRRLLDQLRAGGLEGFGLGEHPLAARAAGALVHHLRETQRVDLAHVRAVTFRRPSDCLLLDPVTLKHLEVLQAVDGQHGASLIGVLDRTVTAMGGRLVRAWLLKPLLSLERVRDRLDAVEEFGFRATDRDRFRDLLEAVHDVERLVSRAVLGQAGPRDLVALKLSLAAIPAIRALLAPFQAPLVRSLVAVLDDHETLRDRLDRTLVDQPPALAREGGFIRDHVDQEIDTLRAISRSGRQIIAELETRERERTGISTLKVRYNRVFGYYIEVSKSNLHAVPADYHRKQTIAGGERFITPDLKAHEEKVLGADERILERELELFEDVRRAVADDASALQESAHALAALDALAGFAEVATVGNYCKPQIGEGDEMIVVDGRHPVVERLSADPFVPNDLSLDGSTRQLMVLTGPNMGGKSTYLRQSALVCLMAQAGSFVPAREARLPIVDRIFARVGASDNIGRGQSTFMVEMQETANILHSATSRSFVILDEIGRGTSTFDGLSIAWAVAEHLATSSHARPKTVFATHYHELTDLADARPGVVNYHVSAREWHDDIVFLRKVVPGRSDRSYGIQVARLAGMPAAVIARAREILTALEEEAILRGGRPSVVAPSASNAQQLGLFGARSGDEPPIVHRLRTLDLDRMTPLEALTTLTEMKKALE